MPEQHDHLWMEGLLDSNGADSVKDPALREELARQRRVHLLLTAQLDQHALDRDYAVISSATSISRRERIASAIGHRVGRPMHGRRPSHRRLLRWEWLVAAALVLAALGLWRLLPAPAPGPEALAAAHDGLAKANGIADFHLASASAGLSLRRAGRELAATAGMAVMPGDSLLASADGTELAYADGSRVRLAAGTQLDLLPADQGKRLHLAAGGISAHVAHQPAGRPMVVSGRSARAEVVGTTFALVEDPLGTRLQVDEGLVRLVDAGTVLDVPAGGQGLSSRHGKPVAYTPFDTAGLHVRKSDGFDSLSAWSIRLGGSMEQSLAADASAEGTTSMRLAFRHQSQGPLYACRGRALPLARTDRAFRFRLRVEQAEPGAEFFLHVRETDGDVWVLAQWPVAAGGGWRTVVVPIPAPERPPHANKSPDGHWQSKQVAEVFLGAEFASLVVCVDQLEVLEGP